MDAPALLAVVPARGGSKRLPRKNVRPLHGKPLLAWTVEAALASGVMRRVVVSTDDEEVRRCALDHGAEAPFLRPAHLATDEATTVAVLQHALAFYEARGESFDYVATLQPTSPMRDAQDLREAAALLARRRPDSLVSVVKPKLHPDWLFQARPDGTLRRAPRDPARPPVDHYAPNGAIYLTRADLVRKGDMYGETCIPYPMPARRSIDVDDETDFRMAECLWEERPRA